MANGFTMVSDYLLWNYRDRILASVYGKIKRFCEMRNGKCSASRKTFEEELCVSDNVIDKKIDILIEAGYVVDKTPGSRKAHIFQVTDKLNQEEERFWEFAEETRNKFEIDKPSFYDLFVTYAIENNIEPFCSIQKREKKPRGKSISNCSRLE